MPIHDLILGEAPSALACVCRVSGYEQKRKNKGIGCYFPLPYPTNLMCTSIHININNKSIQNRLIHTQRAHCTGEGNVPLPLYYNTFFIGTFERAALSKQQQRLRKIGHISFFFIINLLHSPSKFPSSPLTLFTGINVLLVVH